MKKIRVSVPYHITGFWIPIKTPSLLTTGSLGAGIVLDSRVVLEYTSEERNSTVNIDKTSIDALKLLPSSISVDHFVRHTNIIDIYTLGEGYGASGARALAFSITYSILNRLSLCSAGQAAHVAEVLNGTGFADVLAEYTGKGLVVRLSPGAPCIGKTDIIPIKRFYVITAPLGKLSTIEMHAAYGYKIAVHGYRAYREFIENPCIENFLEKARYFSTAVGFMSHDLDSQLREELKSFIAKGIVIGYFIKKKLFVMLLEDIDEEVIEKITKIIKVKPRIDRIGYRGIEVEII